MVFLGSVLRQVLSFIMRLAVLYVGTMSVTRGKPRGGDWAPPPLSDGKREKTPEKQNISNHL